MDPDACLEEMLKLAKSLQDMDPDPDSISSMRSGLEGASRLAELVQALDGWLSKGGFLPKKWERKPPMIEVKTSPLVGYMAEDGRTYCLEHASAVNGWIDRIGEAAAKAADLSCAICGEKLAK